MIVKLSFSRSCPVKAPLEEVDFIKNRLYADMGKALVKLVLDDGGKAKVRIVLEAEPAPPPYPGAKFDDSGRLAYTIRAEVDL